MKQAIVIFPERNKEIELIRKKYDPFYKKFRMHITLVFPFKYIDQNQLNEHIKKSILGIKSFKLVLNGVKKSPKEYYLYFIVKTGNKSILAIHKRLYSHLLTKWLRKDIPYIPHITLGVFKTKAQINKALEKLKNKNLKLETVVDRIYLLNLKKDLSLKSFKRFKFKI